MDFRTEINANPSPFRLDHRKKMLFIGSCFTENIGTKLQELKFPVIINPFGVVYNPMSVKRSLEILINEKEYTYDDLNFHNGLWYSWDHHSSFSHPDKGYVLEHINQEVRRAALHLQETDFLLITFGTARIYKLRENDHTVCNCHKVPASEFNRELLEVDMISSEYHDLFKKLKELNPSMRFIISISPVRHWKDGAHGNQVSKAVLQLAVEKMKEDLPEDLDYFPAYELLLDDLRDYRFYASDMLHPNSQAVDYIWEKFAESYFSPETKEINSKIVKLIKATEHKVNFPGSESHRKFAEKQLENIDELLFQFPFLDLQDLRKAFVF